jgi:hypothetical protein
VNGIGYHTKFDCICGPVWNYFCVRCRHWASSCRCGSMSGGCTCPDESYWAGNAEERRALQMQLTHPQPAIKEGKEG